MLCAWPLKQSVTHGVSGPETKISLIHPDHDWIDFLPAGVDISLDTQRKWQQRRQLEQQHQHLTLVPMPGPQPQCYTVSAAAGLLAAAKPVTCAIQLPSVITLGASHR